MSRFWPASESAQADYERLRDAVVVTGRLPDEVAAARFARRGLYGLIAWPVSQPVFSARLVGAERPDWSPYVDARIVSLAAAYSLLVTADAAALGPLGDRDAEQNRA